MEAPVVAGELPAQLRGMFVRNGPNPRHPPVGRYHWFDGDGMVHGVALSDAGARYVNRYVHTAAFEHDTEPRALSFKHTVQLYSQFSTRSLCQRAEPDSLALFFALIAQQRVGRRPGRLEPRVR